MKVQISINEELLNRADKYATDNYMSRSGLISLSLTQFLNANDVTYAIKDMALSMRKIADTGQLDHETIQKLEDFERLAKMLYGAK